jgi:asparagine synthetase B (glutamine-hydrolysing)
MQIKIRFGKHKRKFGATRKRLMADVPVGVLLWRLDSSLTSAITAKNLQGKKASVSIGLDANARCWQKKWLIL